MGDAHKTPAEKKWGDAPRTNNSSQIYIYIYWCPGPQKNARKGGTPLTSVIAHSFFFKHHAISHVWCPGPQKMQETKGGRPLHQ